MARVRGIAVLVVAAVAAPMPVVAAEEPAPRGRAMTSAAGLAVGFTETIVWSGLDEPTGLRFAADGRAFVIEKSGQIKVFSDLFDTTPTTHSGLMTNTYDYWDHGLLGIALDPSLTGGSGSGDYIYVGYTYDHIIGSGTPAPRWHDLCPTPPGPTTDGCVSSSRVSRMPVSGTSIGAETVLVEGFCQQGPSHGMGSLSFGPDGSLYVTHGEGGLFSPEYGQRGGSTTPVITPKNPCDDPPGGIGGSMTPPTAEGGWLRSQDVRTTGDPAGLDGAVLRINPMTGAGVAGSPFAGSADLNARKIIAYGLRNPFRAGFLPGTSELWVADVGWTWWEEINVVSNATDAAAENFGWPCYEGGGRLAEFDALNLNLCESLYAQGPGAVKAPLYTYNHGNAVVPGETCPPGGAAIVGMAFYPAAGGSFPAAYQGGLFFGDYTRNCIWFMPQGLNGKPNPAAIQPFYEGAEHPVDLVIGPGGDLFYVDFDGGAIRRIAPTPENPPPLAVIQATPPYGPTPLTVDFSAAGSSDPDGTALTYEWDLDGDGDFDDGTSVTAQHTYVDPGNVTVALRVTDAGSASTTATRVIGAGNTPPEPVIAAPVTDFTWRVGETIQLSGSASDTQDGSLAGTSLSWTVKVRHCPSSCHTHPSFFASDGLTASVPAPDHSYPSSLVVNLTAIDSAGASVTVTREISPETVVLTFKSTPTGVPLSFDAKTTSTPFTATVIVGSLTTVSAPTSFKLGTTTYAFKRWSDGGAQAHSILAPATATTYTAVYGVQRTIPARVDAYVRSGYPNRNYGAATVLRTRSGKIRTYIKVDVTGLSARPASAWLRLWVTDGGSHGGFLYRVSNAWKESTITWNNRPLVTGSPIASRGAVTAGTWVEFNVTAAITGNGTYSFAIMSAIDDIVDYASTETSRDPVLIIVQ